MAVLAKEVTVGTSATELVAPARATVYDQWQVVVRNDSGNTVHLGGSGVTTAQGFPLATGTTSPVFVLGPHDDLYGIAGSSSAVRVIITRYSP